MGSHAWGVVFECVPGKSSPPNLCSGLRPRCLLVAWVTSLVWGSPEIKRKPPGQPNWFRGGGAESVGGGGELASVPVTPNSFL